VFEVIVHRRYQEACITREQWLQNAFTALKPFFSAKGYLGGHPLLELCFPGHWF
jgi:hypothetical protein